MSRREEPSLLSSPAFVDDSAHGGIDLLWQAYRYAQATNVSVWDFALEIEKLYEAGLTINDLRWLIANGFCEHGREISVYGDPHRSFQCSTGLIFSKTTCLVITPRGAALAELVAKEIVEDPQSTSSASLASLDRIESALPSEVLSHAPRTGQPSRIGKPKWDSGRRQLTLADKTVKRFRVPARNQELILRAFQEEQWPPHIDDPLPVSEGIDPRTRLHDAINRLNRNQTNPLLYFRGNGRGTGIYWERRDPD